MAALILVLVLVACSGGQGGEHQSEYLAKTIAPCTPIQGSTVDPCEPDVPLTVGRVSLASSTSPATSYPTPLPVRHFLDGRSLPFLSHMVIRATYIPDTERCTSGNPDRDPSYMKPSFGGRPSLQIKCYADVRVNSYILGSGPSRLTVQVGYYYYGPESLLAATRYRGVTTAEQAVEDFRTGFELLMRVGEERRGGLIGREGILFIGPPHDHGTGAWQVFTTWGVETKDDGTAVAVHPHRWAYRHISAADPTRWQTILPLLEMPLSTFTQAVTAAHAARVAEHGGRIGPDDIGGKAPGATLPMLVTDANRLRDFFVATGSTTHPDGPPAQPPPPCGLPVPDHGNNPGLMLDCFALLPAKDALRGTGTLNWATGTAIAAWDGVTVAGTPQRVTKLKLENEGLTGTIPERLADLDALNELKLSGNALTGCIPAALRDVAGNDLADLRLPTCAP